MEDATILDVFDSGRCTNLDSDAERDSLAVGCLGGYGEFSVRFETVIKSLIVNSSSPLRPSSLYPSPSANCSGRTPIPIRLSQKMRS